MWHIVSDLAVFLCLWITCHPQNVTFIFFHLDQIILYLGHVESSRSWVQWVLKLKVSLTRTQRLLSRFSLKTFEKFQLQISIVHLLSVILPCWSSTSLPPPPNPRVCCVDFVDIAGAGERRVGEGFCPHGSSFLTKNKTKQKQTNKQKRKCRKCQGFEDLVSFRWGLRCRKLWKKKKKKKKDWFPSYFGQYDLTIGRVLSIFE